MAVKRKTTTTTKKQSVEEILNRPMPKQALKALPHKRNSKGESMTSITPIYVTDRLNEAFGLGGWQFEPEIISDSEKMVIIKGVLTVPTMNIRIVQFGGNDNRDRGDAYKGAATDALTKCGSYLGIGAHVWRDDEPSETETERVAKIVGPSTTEELITLLEKNENDVNHYLKFVEWIQIDQTFRELPADKAQIVIDRPSDFMAAVAKHIAKNE
jgi:hypothetical protein